MEKVRFAIVLLVFSIIGCHCAEKSLNIAIVNSTTIKDLKTVKTEIPPEEKYVAYVYAKSQSTEIPDSSKDETTTIINEKYEIEYCVVRVDEDNMIKYYNVTIMQQLKDEGKNVLDLLCDGDLGPNDRVLSKGALASLIG